jgi:hypothetical protein
MKNPTLDDTAAYLEWMLEEFDELPPDEQLKELLKKDLPTAPLSLLVSK